MITTVKDYLQVIDDVIKKGKFKNNWESLSSYRVPKWYTEGKFGIFIHWGVYSVPAYGNEWYPRHMYDQNHDVHKHHVETYGETKDFGYKDFIPMFRAEKFDPMEWAELFLKAGAKFVMPVAEHHDGFQMYSSELSNWCAKKMGPCKDILGMLKEAVEENNMKFCASSHRAEHSWFFSESTKYDSGIPKEPEYGDLFWPNRYASDIKQEPVWSHQTDKYLPQQDFLEDWLARCCEIVDKYHPKMMFFDWWIHNSGFKPYLQKFAAYYYNRAIEWGEEVVINYKYDAFAYNTAVLDIERGQMKQASNYPWQCDTSVALNSWSYTEGNQYKKPEEIIGDFVDIISKNGCLLLNVGPKADGTIPEEDKNILLSIGEWMNKNQEAIYNTTPWKIMGEGPTEVKEGAFTDGKRDLYTSEDIRFTYKNGVLYAFVMKLKKDEIVKIQSLAKYSQVFNSIIENVTMLGEHKDISFEQTTDGLFIKTDGMESRYPVCFKISIN